MDPIIVLIVCKAAILPYASDVEEANGRFTGHHPYEWVYKHSKMQCKRMEVPLTDSAANMGADPRPFTPQQCMQAGIMVGAHWDLNHSRYKFWRVACPTKIIDSRTGETIGWKIPECPHTDVVECLLDTAI